MTRIVTKTRNFGAAPKAAAVDRLVLATVNAPYKREIDAKTLAECIAKSKLDQWQVHLVTFFTDVAPDLVLGFAETHGISRSKLAKTYRAIKAETAEKSPALEAQLVAMAPAAR